MAKSNQVLDNFRIKFPEKKKFRFFFLFVILSFTFWIITKLSNNYDSSISFSITLTDVPNYIVPKNTGSLELNAEIRGSGFQLLLYKFINDEMLNVLIFFINELIEFFLLKSDLIKKRLFGYFFFNFLTAFEFLLYCKITTQLLFKKTLIT